MHLNEIKKIGKKMEESISQNIFLEKILDDPTAKF